MADPLIIGIHGLNNKPAPDVLAGWWRAALLEGLARNFEGSTAALPFKLVYWADLNHAIPVAPEADKEPYLPAAGEGALPEGRRGLRARAAMLGLEAAGKVAETIASAPGFDDLVEELVEAKAADLHRYQNDGDYAAAVRERLRAALREAVGAGQPVLLIAHSMGSIIAYDVLREHPGLPVGHLVTIGSPLGLGEVKAASRRAFGRAMVPSGVAKWTNMADPADKISGLDQRLRSDYAANERGVRITDVRVRNTYIGPAGKANAHKIYGYLRTPEMSRLVAGWIA